MPCSEWCFFSWEYWATRNFMWNYHVENFYVIILCDVRRHARQHEARQTIYDITLCGNNCVTSRDVGSLAGVTSRCLVTRTFSNEGLCVTSPDVENYTTSYGFESTIRGWTKIIQSMEDFLHWNKICHKVYWNISYFSEEVTKSLATDLLLCLKEPGLVEWQTYWQT
jgi:hypothetical protein